MKPAHQQQVATTTTPTTTTAAAVRKLRQAPLTLMVVAESEKAATQSLSLGVCWIAQFLTPEEFGIVGEIFLRCSGCCCCHLLHPCLECLWCWVVGFLGVPQGGGVQQLEGYSN